MRVKGLEPMVAALPLADMAAVLFQDKKSDRPQSEGRPSRASRNQNVTGQRYGSHEPTTVTRDPGPCAILYLSCTTGVGRKVPRVVVLK
eukprot:7313895-Prymnesium_polylepis.1